MDGWVSQLGFLPHVQVAIKHGRESSFSFGALKIILISQVCRKHAATAVQKSRKPNTINIQAWSRKNWISIRMNYGHKLYESKFTENPNPCKIYPYPDSYICTSYNSWVSADLSRKQIWKLYFPSKRRPRRLASFTRMFSTSTSSSR